VKETSNPNNIQPVETASDDSALRARIEQRAYHIWLASGGGHGEHLNHWLRAETEVLKAIKQEQEERSTARTTRPPAKQRSTPVSNESNATK